MMKNIGLFLLTVLFLMLAACGPEMPENRSSANAETAVSPSTSHSSPEQNQMEGVSERARSMMSISIPDEYVVMRNPIPPDEASILRGGETYATHCATCHGDSGAGDGPAGAKLDPAPANIARTSQILNDGYLFWRITEGGVGEPFNSAMIAWGNILSENERWDVLNYVRALGSGQVMPDLAATQDKMLETAVAKNLITADQVVVYTETKTVIDAAIAERKEGGCSKSGDAIMEELFVELVNTGELTETAVDDFIIVQGVLADAALMN